MQEGTHSLHWSVTSYTIWIFMKCIINIMSYVHLLSCQIHELSENLLGKPTEPSGLGEGRLGSWLWLDSRPRLFWWCLGCGLYLMNALLLLVFVFSCGTCSWPWEVKSENVCGPLLTLFATLYIGSGWRIWKQWINLEIYKVLSSVETESRIWASYIQ